MQRTLAMAIFPIYMGYPVISHSPKASKQTTEEYYSGIVLPNDKARVSNAI